jgi:thiaminase/transcriptional activator TenA
MGYMKWFSLSCFISTSLLAQSFIELATEKAAPIVRGIIAHPFVQELANGTLSSSRLNYYKDQDQLYVVKYAQAISVVSSKVQNITEAAWLDHEAVQSYNEHGGQLPTPEVVQCPMCQAYSDFEMTAVMRQDVGSGIAALLPCYTVYAAVAQWLAQHADFPNPNEAWIRQYTAPGFNHSTDRISSFANRLYDAASNETRMQMMENYVKAARFEWYFWDSAYASVRWKSF